jgi:hypothetical protein
MALETLNRWLTLLANLGVCAGFVALTVQMSQNTAAIRTQSANEAVRAVAAAQLAVLGDDGAAALAKAMLRPAEMTEAQILQLWLYADAILGSSYNIWLAHQAGLASEADWVETKRGVGYLLDYDPMRIVWDRYKADAFPQGFIDEFDPELKKSRPRRVGSTLREIVGDIRRLGSEDSERLDASAASGGGD